MATRLNDENRLDWRKAQRITISMDSLLVMRINRFCKRDAFPNRSEFFRKASIHYMTSEAAR
jgi:metal-responsive CopG/Arc/MetJ family transcriptional regulator